MGDVNDEQQIAVKIKTEPVEEQPQNTNCDKPRAEEDVPPDFFDDFSNKDFLAGLDVLDAWEDGENTQDNEDSKANIIKLTTIQPTAATPNDVCAKKIKKERKSPDNYRSTRRGDEGSRSRRYSRDRNDGKSGVRDSKLRSRTKELSPRTGVKSRKRRSFSFSRRTRDRTVSRSRDRRSRSRERRSRSKERRSRSRQRKSRSQEFNRRDPNKTRRDIQRDKDRCEKDKQAKIISEKLRVVETGLVPPGTEMEPVFSDASAKSPEREIIHKRNLSKSISPKNPKRRYRSPVVRRSLTRQFKPSPIRYQQRHMRTSPYRHRDRSPEYRRHDHYRGHRSKSPSASFFASPERSKSRISKEMTPGGKKSFLEEIDRKLTLREEQKKLREIQEKINGIPNTANILHKYGHVVPPQTIPTPCMPQYSHQQTYDQQFYTGVPDMHSLGYNPMPVPHPQEYYPPQQGYYNPPQTNQNFTNNVPQTGDFNSTAIQKLFHDASISLTSFLNITARTVSVDSKSIDLRNKIVVLRRCQDTIRLHSPNTKQSGRFFYKEQLKQMDSPKPEHLHMSPLLKQPRVQFNFNTVPSQMDESINIPINRLLLKLGLPYIQKRSAPPKPTVNQNEVASSGNVEVLQKMVQTDPYRCEDCAVRKSKKYVDVEVQCGAVSVDFQCQVREDDFLVTARSALSMFMKTQSPASQSLPTQSLATLTPAQILAQTGNNRDEDGRQFNNTEYYMRSDMERNYDSPQNFPTRSFGNSSNYGNPYPASRNSLPPALLSMNYPVRSSMQPSMQPTYPNNSYAGYPPRLHYPGPSRQ